MRFIFAFINLKLFKLQENRSFRLKSCFIPTLKSRRCWLHHATFGFGIRYFTAVLFWDFFQVVEAVAAALRSSSVSEAELKAAKKALAMEISESNLSALDLAVDVGISGILRSGHPLSGLDKLDLVAQATLADVQVIFKTESCKYFLWVNVGNHFSRRRLLEPIL